jgi:hypothetical protein
MTARQMANRAHRASARAPEPVVSADDVLELIAYLLASAELCMSEPYHYGSFRLAGYAITGGRARDEAWLGALKREIDDHKGLLMWDREAYVAYLHEVTGKVAEYIKRETPA